MISTKQIKTLETLLKVKNYDLKSQHYKLKDMLNKRSQLAKTLVITQKKYLDGITLANESRLSNVSSPTVWDFFSSNLKNKWIILHQKISEIDLDIKNQRSIISELKKKTKQMEKKIHILRESLYREETKKQDSFINDLYGAKMRRM